MRCLGWVAELQDTCTSLNQRWMAGGESPCQAPTNPAVGRIPINRLRRTPSQFWPPGSLAIDIR
ncbi:hypothetical protein OAE40_02175 [Rubripirellula sp.]|nr:hypothetical protein [Rubripirellula sp.]